MDKLFEFSVGHEAGIKTAKKNAEKVCADMCCDKAKLDSQINALYVFLQSVMKFDLAYIRYKLYRIMV